ncbi:MAG: methyltransferase domain-containing protein [Scytonematopsis contorta HA4267-MV1]|nr:methyltransferase domain-containing protein [Scytonematopsis contorta HA4267-MV1]
MTDFPLSAYKQQILNDFNNRPHYENEFHKRAANRLVELAKIQPGRKILDIATGSGLVAIAAAQIVGDTGYVFGFDISPGMLQQAQEKVTALSLNNIQLEEADADEREFEENQFDAVLCSSAIVYLTDIPKALRRWHYTLKTRGIIAFSCLAETSPSASVLFREVVQRHGITIPNPNEILGTPDKCKQMLQTIGFEKIEIMTEEFGFYFQDPEIGWTGNAKSAFGLQEVHWTEEELNKCKQEYFTQLLNMASTEQGFWNDITMFFVTACKY